MHRPGGASRLVGVVGALLGVLLMGMAAPALAGVTLSVAPDLQVTVRHGQAGLAGRLTITNNNSFPNDADSDLVSNVTLTPSCGDKTGSSTCGTADPGIFSVTTPALGRTGTACGGLTFDVTTVNAGTGQLSVTPQPPAPSSFTLGPSTGALATRQCVIDFTFSVTSNFAEPAIDSDPIHSGKQTTAHAGADAVDPSTGESGGGVGTADISFPILTTSTQPASGTLGVTTLQDQAALVGTTITLFPSPANTATGTITFSLFDPTAPNCTGSPRHTEDINLTACSSSTASAGFSGCSTVSGFIADQVGTWHWLATYSGDTFTSGPLAGQPRNVSVSSNCGDEPVTITQPVLTIQKTPDGTTYKAGDTVSFTVVVTNTGPGTAVNVHFSPRDTLPVPSGSSLSWGPTNPTVTCSAGVVNTPSPACTVSGNVLSCSFGDFPVNGSCSVTVRTATQASNTADCVPTPGLQNSATAVADNAGAVTDSGNQFCIGLPHLTIQKTPDNTIYKLGDTINFTIVVTSDGKSTAHNVHFSPADTLPDPNGSLNWGPTNPTVTCSGQSGAAPSCTVSAVSPGTPNSQALSCTLGDLAVNGSCTVTVSSATQATDTKDCVGPPPGLVNTACVTADGLSAACDTGSQSCGFCPNSNPLVGPAGECTITQSGSPTAGQF